jgi:hypothetical protein
MAGKAQSADKLFIVSKMPAINKAFFDDENGGPEW